jgi:type IV pilus assembly protein PilM
MSWNFRSHDLQPIGLDIGHDSIKMIQLDIGEGQIRVVAADKVRIDSQVRSDDALRRRFVISAIQQMRARGSFRGKAVISCVPNEQMRITSLRLAESGPDEVEEALRKEMAQRFGLNPDKDSMDYIVAGSVRQGDEIKNELILFAVDSPTIENHVKMLEEAKLRPVAIDTMAGAIFRSFERLLRRQEDKERILVLVDVGSSSTVAVFGDNGAISFVKHMPIGGQRFANEIGSRLGVGSEQAERLRRILRRGKNGTAGESTVSVPGGVDDGAKMEASTKQVVVDAISSIAEELAGQISRCLRYYTVTFRGTRIERVYLTGGEAYEGILVNVMRRQLPVDVEVGQPLKGFDLSAEGARINFDSDKRGLLCEWAVAVGLGLKGQKLSEVVS